MMGSRRTNHRKAKGAVVAYRRQMQKGRVSALPLRQSDRERLLAGARLLGRFLERFLLCLRIGQRLRIALGCVHVLFQRLGLLRSTRDIADFLDLRLFLLFLLALGFFRRAFFLGRHLRFRSFGGISFSLELALIAGRCRGFLAWRNFPPWPLSL